MSCQQQFGLIAPGLKYRSVIIVRMGMVMMIEVMRIIIRQRMSMKLRCMFLLAVIVIDAGQ